MNIIYFMGGLGNQMFQYALYKSLESCGLSTIMANTKWYSEDVGKRPFELHKVFPNVELHNDENDIFGKKEKLYRKIRKKGKWVAFLNYHVLWLCSFFREKEDGIYDDRVYRLRNAAMKGYWQTEKYFKDIKEIISRDFTFSYGEEMLQIWRHKLLRDNKSVAIHIRRGDYLQYQQYFVNLSESQYYVNAIDYINKRVQEPHLIFFSNDISWVKENYCYKDAIYVDTDMFEQYEAWYDMCLMSCCAHNIIANSSFSWWGAWLNTNIDKIVVAPKEWLKGKKTPDIWCDDWILL